MGVGADGLSVYYINHSGFAIDVGKYAFVIDYYNGGLKGVEPGAAPLPRPAFEYGYVAVLSSHVHPDHYSKDIFGWRNETGLGDIKYILSKDIERRAERDGASEADVEFVEPGDTARVGDAVVRAFGSTDQGVSFLIDAPSPAGESRGARVFHAGDLNYWHWRDLATDEEAAFAKMSFLRELSLITAACPAESIDVACFPVDPRLGSDYYRGAVMFCEALRPKYIIPMHFGARFDPPSDFYKEMEPLTRVVRVGEPGSRAVPE